MKGVSIIIPTFNREKFVAKAIDSVLQQDYDGEIEIIISDDGSTDRTVEIARGFGDMVKILLKPSTCKNQGASATRNRALLASTHSYICFLDSDDLFLPGHIMKMVTAIQANKGVGFAFCRVLEMDDSKNTAMFRQWTKERITSRDISNIGVSKHNVAHTNGFIFRKQVFEAAGTFNELYKNGEDTDLWMRINELYKGAFSDHYGAVRRRHDYNQLTDNSQVAIVENHYKIFKNALTRYFELGIRNHYRLGKLLLLVFKYQVGRQKLFHRMYPYYYNFRNKIKNESPYFPISHFIPVSQVTVTDPGILKSIK